MPRKTQVPVVEPSTRRKGWTIFVYYLDLDGEMQDEVKVFQLFAGDEMQAGFIIDEAMVKGVRIHDGTTIRAIPAHRIQMILGQDTRG